MTAKLDELEGMTSELADALRTHGITDSDKLLAASAQPDQRTELAKALGISPKALLKMANHADLARIRGVGKIYSSLLEFAGVDTVAELANRRADNLFKKITETAASHHVKRVPRADEVESWVEQAKQLERKLYY